MHLMPRCHGSLPYWAVLTRRATLSLMLLFALTSCGEPTASLLPVDSHRGAIVRGSAAASGDYPATGAVLRGPDPHLAVHGATYGLCTGTLIGPQVVLTAAHCVAGQPVGLLGFTHQADVSASMTGPIRPLVLHTVQEAVVHPQTISTLVDIDQHNDIALLFLHHPIPDALPTPWLQPCEAEVLREDSEVTIVGYGRRDVGVPGSVNYGIKQYAGARITAVGSYEMDLGLLREGAYKCQGDSGGPTLMTIQRDGIWQSVQVGITSHVRGRANACENGAVDVRVDAYDDWIRDQMTRRGF